MVIRQVRVQEKKGHEVEKKEEGLHEVGHEGELPREFTTRAHMEQSKPG